MSALGARRCIVVESCLSWLALPSIVESLGCILVARAGHVVCEELDRQSSSRLPANVDVEEDSGSLVGGHVLSSDEGELKIAGLHELETFVA